jgi:hypothetical protein
MHVTLLGEDFNILVSSYYLSLYRRGIIESYFKKHFPSQTLFAGNPEVFSCEQTCENG